MKKIEKKIIEEVPLFKKIKKISKIDGGITNQNFMVKNQMIMISLQHLLKMQIN